MPSSCKPFNFPSAIKHRMNAYAIAAGAAASLLATTQPVHAEVVFTRIDMTFRNGRLPLDVDGDGMVDFILSNDEFREGKYSGKRTLTVEPGSAGEIQNTVAGCASACFIAPEARAFHIGDVIGSNRQFLTGRVRLDSIHQYLSAGAYCYGYFQGDGFLGLKFQISGETHYGWVSFSNVTCGYTRSHNLSITANINGMAYETVPNQPIMAGDKGPSAAGATPSSEAIQPQPASLGVLALGAPGLSIWRRE